MLKATITTALAMLALAAPAAAVAGGGHPGGHVRDRVHHARAALARHCGAGADEATQQRCAEAARKVATKLQELDDRIDAKLTELQARCADASQPCSTREQRLVDVLTKLKQRVEKVAAWIDAHGQVPAGADQLAGD
jgi:DNA anti-recombination protein RmuC